MRQDFASLQSRISSFREWERTIAITIRCINETYIQTYIIEDVVEITGSTLSRHIGVEVKL